MLLSIRRVSLVRDLFRPGAGVRAILKNASWIMGEQIIRMLAGIFVGVWIARQLGPTDYGLLSFTQAACGMVAVVAALGFTRIVVRELVECRDDRDRQARLITTVFVLRTLAALLLYGLTVGLSTSLLGGERALLFALVGVSILASPFDCVDLYFQSRSRSRITATARSLAFFATTALKIGLLLSGASLTLFAAAVAVEYALNGLSLLLAYKRYGLPLRIKPDWAMGRQMFRETWTDVIAAFSVLFFMRGAQLMLEPLRGPAEVGIYTAATRLSEAWNFIPVSLVSSAFPKIMQRRGEDSVYYGQISRLLVALVGVSLLVGVSVTLLSDQIVALLYGAKFAGTGSILAVNIWCGLFVGFGTVSGNWLIAERRLVLNLQRALLGMLVVVVLGLLLIPRFGALGASWATLLAMAAAYYLFDLMHPFSRRMFFIKSRALTLRRSK